MNIPLTLDNLCSGSLGAAIMAIVGWLYNKREEIKSFNASMDVVAAECDFNLSILNEVVAGSSLVGGASFKRMAVDYFKSVRVDFKKEASSAFYAKLDRVITDLDLLNRQAELAYMIATTKRKLTGDLGGGRIASMSISVSLLKLVVLPQV